jgi:methylenetetrahydrofolate dehydrogenase (NADP+)/methenyltetrahydrofolate cyclohydrolase
VVAPIEAPGEGMAAQRLDGNALAKQIRGELAAEVAAFVAEGHAAPRLAAVLVGDDPASDVYVRNKRRDCEQVGMTSRLDRLPAATTQAELLTLIGSLNDDPAIDGILVQLPLPPQIDTRVVLEAICPQKDVDAFHPENVGLLVQGQPRFLPCTPNGVQLLLLRNQLETAGKHAVVIGRSDIVGKPLAIMLGLRGPGGDATVTLCHSRTPDLPAIARQADILVAAIGKPRFVTADMVREGAVVIDVGINRTDEGLVGDVDFEPVAAKAGWITPVPGGVGPLTRVCLLINTLRAARARRGQRD